MAEKRKSYPHNADTVFACVKKICASSFTIKNVDESVRRIIMTTGPSLLSYGETIEVIVQPEENDKALVYVKSAPKAFFNITAQSTAERNIQKIYQMLDNALE